MRKLIWQMMVTVDGFGEGPNKEIDWHVVDDEFNAYAIDVLNNVDALIFGRVTYELMAAYWPTAQALKDDPIVAGKMNGLAKIVVSRTMKNADWNNTRIVKDHVAEEILKLKQQPGKDLAIFGSNDLVVSLIAADLIDEFRVFVAPVVLGNGKSLFKGIDGRLQLKLLSSRTFRSGNVLLCYRRAT